MEHLNPTHRAYPLAGLLLAGLLAPTLGFGQTAFTQGTLSVIRYGALTGTVPPTGQALPAFLDEYTTTGTRVRSITIPTANSGSSYGLTGSSIRTNNDGVLGVSPDRSRLALGGYNEAVGTANVSSTSTADRVLAIFNAQGVLTTTAGVSSGTNPLRTTLPTNSAGIYVAFGAETAGITYAPYAAPVSPPNGATPTVITPTVSAKKMQVYDGNLYFSTSSVGGNKIRRYTGLPTASAVPTDLPGLPTAASPAAGPFVMFDVNASVPGVDLLYYADDVTAGSPVNKYTFNGTTWTLRGTYTLSGVTDGFIRDMTGQLENGVPTLYAATYTSLVKLADNAAYTATISVARTNLVDNLSGGSYAFRGISFSPGTREPISLATASAQLAADVTLSPNPAQGEVLVGLPATLQREPIGVTVVNTLGQQVLTRTLAAGATRTLALSGLAAGVYTVRLETSAGTVNKRLVCE